MPCGSSKAASKCNSVGLTGTSTNSCCLLQAYAIGSSSSQQVAAQQEVWDQLHSPDEAVIPICLVHESAPADAAAEKDYHKFGSGDVNLQVTLFVACSFHQQDFRA